MAGPQFQDVCETMRGQIAPYVAGKLTSIEAADLTAHLELCEACAREAAFARLLVSAAPRLPVPVPPPGLHEKIALATYAAPPRRGLRETLLSFLTPAPARLALGTAFAVSIAALVVLPNLPRPDAPPPVAVTPATPPVAVESGNVTPPAKIIARRPTNPTPDTVGSKPALTAKTRTPSTAETVSPVPDVTTEATPQATPDQFAVRPAPAKLKSRPAPQMSSGSTKTAQYASANPAKSVKLIKTVTPGDAVAPKPNKVSDDLVAGMTPKQPVIEASPAVEPERTVEPEIDRAVKVAVRLPEVTAPATGEGAEDPSAASVRNYTLRGASTASRSSGIILASRSGRDQASPTATVSIVQAPAKLD